MRSWWAGLLRRASNPPLFTEPREAALERSLDYQFRNPELLATALTHPSAAKPGGPHYERLEFLGDAVLDLAIADLLMRRLPEAKEGVLSKERASIVNGKTLALKALEVGVAPRIRLGKGEEKSGGRAKTSILAASFEAVIGALYSDGGLAAATPVIETLFADEIGGPAAQRDYKTELQEIAYRSFQAPPIYELISAQGPEHAKLFVTKLSIAGRELGIGEGASKKSSEQAAARMALDAMTQDRNGNGPANDQ